jgi:hypothetical protein
MPRTLALPDRERPARALHLTPAPLYLAPGRDRRRAGTLHCQVDQGPGRFTRPIIAPSRTMQAVEGYPAVTACMPARPARGDGA